MNPYRLAVLMHGANGEVFHALQSFFERVRPAPMDCVLYCDGEEGWRDAHRAIDKYEQDGLAWTFVSARSQLGFCGATRTLWDAAARLDGAEEHDYVFWLEHDFTFKKDVRLEPLAEALDIDQMIAQIQLMRGAVNDQEKAAGGLYELRKWEYQSTWYGLEHVSYFTTNPSLMRRSFMHENPFPDDVSLCEGLFGVDLTRRGYTYGVAGNGEPWVEHFGIRHGYGY